MFISISHLHGNMGVDEEIARFFVNRKVPKENAFWDSRRLYITRGNGYLSIPVYYDLLCRIGVSKTYLLDESHIKLMERIMHYAIQEERSEIDFGKQLNQISDLFEGRIKNSDFYFELMEYLQQPVLMPKGKLGMQVPALNRADVFLFILCDLPLAKEVLDKAIQLWYALHTSYLLMDDIYDYELDKQNLEENAIVELGDGMAGSSKAFEILHANTGMLKPVNPILSSFFDHAFLDLQKLTP
jgi:hypothetical protein